MTCLADHDVGAGHDVGADHDVGPAVTSVPIIELDDFRVLSGRHRDDAYMAVEREIRRLQGVQAAMLSEVRRSASFVDDCHHSATAWVRAVSNSSGATAAYRSRVAELLADLPLLADALGRGAVGPDQLRLLARLHANDRCRPRLPEFETALVEYARSLTYGEFRLVCQRFEQHADPDGTHRDHELSREGRSVRISAVGAGHVLHAEGDALSGDILAEILDAHADAELEIDLQERRDRHGDNAGSHPLTRTARQRRYDALVAIFLKAAGTTDSTQREPLVNIFCTEASLAAALRDSSTDVFSVRLPHSETASGAPVDARDLAVAALIGQVRRVVVDSMGRVIDLGRRSRLFTGAARDAVLLSGDRCTFPGCELRTPRIQIDHLTSWSRAGGETNQRNGGPACAAHNRGKHAGRITVSRDATGWHYLRSDGTEIAPRGH